MNLELSAPRSAHPSMVLAAYVEPLVRGRRVAVLGDATLGLAEALVSRGARLVHAYDPESSRVAEALALGPRGGPSHVSYAVLASDLGVRDGAFEAVIIPDLSLFADPEDVVRQARRLTSKTGVCVIASPNPASIRRLFGTPRPAAAPDYYALYDLVSLQFPVVRMAGQAPFVGFAIAEFAEDEEPEVTVDTSLLAASEEPEWFIAVASDRSVEIERFAVIELPITLLSGGASQHTETDDHVAIAELTTRLSLVTLELEKARDRQREEAVLAARRGGDSEAMSARLATVSQELESKATLLKELDGRAGDAHVRAERLAHDLRDMEEELRNQRERAVKLSKQLDEEKRARTKAELELGMIRNKPEISGAKDRLESMGADVASARQELEAKGAALALAEAKIVDLEASSAALALANTRLAELEAKGAALALANTKLAELEKKGPALALAETKIAELEAKGAALAEAEAKIAELEAKAVADKAWAKRANDLERAMRDSERSKLDLAAQKAAAEHRVGKLDQVIAEVKAAHEALEARCTELQNQLALAQNRPIASAEPDTGAADDVAAMEARLVERGATVARLERDLREGERIGRELVEELESLRAAAERASAAGGAAGATSEKEAMVLRGRLDALAGNAARCQADLEASGWRVAELERKLEAAERAPSVTPGAIQLELEQALIAAHEEVASLRDALTGEKSARLQMAAAVTETSVLVEQAAGSPEE